MAEVTGRSLGQYRVLELVGEGGMARVYRGHQPTLDRDVAIKVIPASGQGDQDAEHAFFHRFVTEARVIARLAHPYIVPIHDFGVDSDWAYLVMEFITGGSVRDEMNNARAMGQRLAATWALAILDQVATALDFAHMKGIVHRDVKPGNMLLRDPAMVVLSDFGVAKMLADRSAVVGRAVVMGTPQYMAPEQAMPDAPVDGRSDIYSLGVVLYECITGQIPFTGETGEAIMLKHLQEPPPPPRAIDPAILPSVERIILRAMAKDPAARYGRAAEMAADLRAAHAEAMTARAPSMRRAGPTAPVGVVQAPSTPHVGRVPPISSGPGACFRCGAANTPGNTYCVACGYDMTSNRAAMDTYLAFNGRPLRCRLVFRTGPFERSAFRLHQGVTTIGRGAGNDVLLQQETVSRQHARLAFVRGSWYVEDMGSANGVFVNRMRVNRPLLLNHGDVIRFGDIEAIFEMVD